MLCPVCKVDTADLLGHASQHTNRATKVTAAVHSPLNWATRRRETEWKGTFLDELPLEQIKDEIGRIVTANRLAAAQLAAASPLLMTSGGDAPPLSMTSKTTRGEAIGRTPLPLKPHDMIATLVVLLMTSRYILVDQSFQKIVRLLSAVEYPQNSPALNTSFVTFGAPKTYLSDQVRAIDGQFYSFGAALQFLADRRCIYPLHPDTPIEPPMRVIIVTDNGQISRTILEAGLCLADPSLVTTTTRRGSFEKPRMAEGRNKKIDHFYTVPYHLRSPMSDKELMLWAKYLHVEIHRDPLTR